LCIYLFFKICKRSHALENNVQYVERYSVTKEEEEEEEEEEELDFKRQYIYKQTINYIYMCNMSSYVCLSFVE
jgi:hypothetical protein